MSNNEKILLDEIKELKDIIYNYNMRDMEILNLYNNQNKELYRFNYLDNKLDNDIIINKFKNVLEREKDLHKILKSKYLKVEKCNNCGKIYLPEKDTYFYLLSHFCSKECLEQQR